MLSEVSQEQRSRPGVYRVDYQAGDDDGHLLLRTVDTSTDRIVTDAADLLHERGIEARIRRIIPVV